MSVELNGVRGYNYSPMVCFLREIWQQVPGRSKEFCVLFLLVLAGVGLVGYSVAGAEDIFRVTKEMHITADITGLPLGQALEILSQNMALEVRGNVAGDERLTLRFSQLTVQQALREMMAGYNYVLIEPGAQGPLVLVIIGKAEKEQIALPAPSVGGAMPGTTDPDTAGPPSVTASLPTPTGVPSPPPMALPGQSAALPPLSQEAPDPSTAAATPAYSEATAPSSSGTAAPLPPVPPPPTTPVPAGPVSGVQAATTGQTNQPPDASAQGTAATTPNPDSQQEFNPAAWGGRGYQGPLRGKR